MKKKLLNLRGISDILSEKEMKNVVGGSSGTGSVDMTLIYCKRWKGKDVVYFNNRGWDMAYAWMAAWEGLDWSSTCSINPIED